MEIVSMKSDGRNTGGTSRPNFSWMRSNSVLLLQIEDNYISAVLVWAAITLQPASNFWTFMVVLPTTFCFEVGNEIDHQVRVSARSGFRSLTWMRPGSMKPIE